MFNVAALMLITTALAIGWGLGRYQRPRRTTRSGTTSTLSRDYFVGLNYLLNEQPDKAIETFSHSLEVNSDTIDTHIALGNLFRLRGEADRAARIHQNLLARPALSEQQSDQVQLELARDFYHLGVLDRSERLLIALIRPSAAQEMNQAARQLLVEIYQREQEWQRALDIAQPLVKHFPAIRRAAAHWQCELADDDLQAGHTGNARKHLRHALSTDAECLRANWLLADMEHQQGKYRDEIKFLKRMQVQDQRCIALILPRMVKAHEALGDESGLMQYLNNLLHHHPHSTTLITIAERLQKQEGAERAADMVSRQLEQTPSLKGVDYLLALYLDNESDGPLYSRMGLLKQHTEHLLKQRPKYQCQECGFKSQQHYWQCPQCRQWGTLLPITGIEGE